MALYSRQIDNYIGGVSQQAYNLRYANQFNTQINCISSLVNGLVKRPPIQTYPENVGYNFGVETSKLRNIKVDTHLYSRGTENHENFLITISRFHKNTQDTWDQNKWYLSVENEIHIRDLNGKSYNVNGYRDSSNDLGNVYVGATTITKTEPTEVYEPNEKPLKFLSVEDTTFVLNTTKKVLEQVPPNPLNNGKKEAIFYVKQSDYGKKYEIKIHRTDGSEAYAYHITPDGSESSHSSLATTDVIAKSLSDGLNNLTSVTSRIVGGNIIIAEIGEDDEIEVSDGLGGRGLIGIKDTVSNFEDLPDQCSNGFTCKVINTGEALEDDYYVKFETKSSTGDGLGTWSEVVKEGEEVGFFNMPIGIVYDEDNEEFVMRNFDWDKRSAGDSDSNPVPSFTNQRITDLCIFQDRLTFISDTYVIMSESSNYFNFFRNSVLSARDDDPIDIGSSAYNSYSLHSLVPWDEALMIFSNDKQFTLRSNSSSLTNKSVTISQSGSYESLNGLKPKEAGNNLLFTANNGKDTTLYEMYSTDYDNLEARGVTSHVSSYIPKDIYILEVLDVYNMAIMVSKSDPSSIYVYQYLFNGSEKVQSAFHKWETDFKKIRSLKFYDNYLYIIANDGGYDYLFKMEINDRLEGDNLDYEIYLDKRSHYDYETYSQISNKTMNVYYVHSTDETRIFSNVILNNPVVVTDNNKDFPSGYLPEQKVISNKEIILKGDWTKRKFYVGDKYTQYLEHSTMVSINPQTNQPDIGGKVQLIKHTLTYNQTGHFKVDIERQNGGNSRQYEFYSKKLNDFTDDFKEYPVKSGTFSYNVKAENVAVKLSITNDSHLPCNIQSSEYAYRFYKKTN